MDHFAIEAQQVCTKNVADILDDILETQKLLNWHRSERAQTQPELAHSNMNYHSFAYEMLDHYIRNALTVFARPHKTLGNCAECLKETLEVLPGYLGDKIQLFYTTLKPCVTSVSPFTGEPMSQGFEPEMCVTWKMKMLRNLQNSVEKRARYWLDKINAGELEISAETELFTDDEIKRSATYVPRWPLMVHVIAATTQMGLSGWYHAFGDQSAWHYELFRRFDYSGICVMIMGSMTSPYYYVYMCDESWFWGQLYMGIAVVLCSIALYVTLGQTAEGENRSLWLNAIAYLAASWGSVFGLVHATYWLPDEQNFKFQIWPWLTGGVLYSVGAVFYAIKFPERFFPRTFDNSLNSHTIFHYFIIAAAMLHFWASVKSFHERQVFGCPEDGTFATAATS